MMEHELPGTGRTRTQLRIVHTSDLHLDSLSPLRCYGMEGVVDLALKSKANLVIIAGDLFDHHRIHDDVIRFAVQQLGRLPVPVVILPGNHDCLVEGGVYHRVDLWREAANIRIISLPKGETLAFADMGLVLWGKPITYYGDNIRPLAGIPKFHKNGFWHIAVAHGYYVDTDFPSFPSLHISTEEVVDSGQDYIAMGHRPVFDCVCDEPVKAYYSGSPFVSGTAAIVDLTDREGVQVTRHVL